MTGDSDGEFKDIHLAQSAWAEFLPSPQEMARYDAQCISRGTSALKLMEQAGESVSDRVRTLSQALVSQERPAVVLCGPGNNGGDGAVVARHLQQAGLKTLLVLASAPRLSSELITNLDRWSSLKGIVHIFGEPHGVALGSVVLCPLSEAELRDLIERSAFVVDALLGTGQHQSPQGGIKRILEILLDCRRATTPIVSIDSPTGINAETGEVYTPHVRADETVSIELLKRGLLQYPAREACGKLCAVSVGITCLTDCEFSLLSRRTLSLPPRKADAHKGEAGRVWLLAGSREMPGAAILSALGALHAGAGLITQIKVKGVAHGSSTAPEVIHALVADEDGDLCSASMADIEQALALADSVVIGPGLGLTERSRAFFRAALCFLIKHKLPTVVDADGLTLLAESLGSGGPDLSRMVLTPHPGEMARLLGVEIAEVQRDRYASARRLAELTGAVVVLKGASSIVYGQKRGFVNMLGNPYMATAGSGDVLAGVVGTLLAQKHAALTAAKIAVYVHARAGDLAQQKSGGPICASEIALCVSQAIGELISPSMV